MVLMVAALVVAQKLDLNRVSLFDLKQLIKILPVSVFYNANVAFALAGLAQLNVSNFNCSCDIGYAQDLYSTDCLGTCV